MTFLLLLLILPSLHDPRAMQSKKWETKLNKHLMRLQLKVCEYFSLFNFILMLLYYKFIIKWYQRKTKTRRLKAQVSSPFQSTLLPSLLISLTSLLLLSSNGAWSTRAFSLLLTATWTYRCITLKNGSMANVQEILARL